MAKKPLMPPTYFWFFFILMIAVHFLIPSNRIIPTPYNYLGVVPLLIGLWVNIWASNLFDKRETTIKPFQESSVLIIEGSFKYSRNPMYVGMALALAGLFVILGSLWPVFGIPVFMILMHYVFILPEEKDLEKKFGAQFLDYKKKVRRWI